MPIPEANPGAFPMMPAQTAPSGRLPILPIVIVGVVVLAFVGWRRYTASAELHKFDDLVYVTTALHRPHDYKPALVDDLVDKLRKELGTVRPKLKGEDDQVIFNAFAAAADSYQLCADRMTNQGAAIPPPSNPLVNPNSPMGAMAVEAARGAMVARPCWEGNAVAMRAESLVVVWKAKRGLVEPPKPPNSRE